MSVRQFKEVNVDIYRMASPRLPAKVIVEWEWERSSIPLHRYTIDVYRGESPSDLDLIASNLQAEKTSHYEDNTARLIDKHRVYYYQLVALDKKTGKVVESDLHTWEVGLDYTGLYVVEEHDFLFRYVVGSPIYIYKKQTEGETRCDNCWDPISKRVTKSNCRVCHGTGFIGTAAGGYYDPVYTWADLSPDPEMIQIAQWGKVQPSQTDIFMTNYPRLSVGDVIIEILPNKRYKVANVRDTEKNRTKMLQIVRLDELSRDRVEYDLNVPKDVKEKARREMNERRREPEF